MKVEITILTAIGIGLALSIASVVADRVYQFVRRKRAIYKGPVNPLPEKDSLPVADESEIKLLELYVEEWKAVIETQMHFNDLILRFRSITLSASAVLIGGSVALVKLTPKDINVSFIYGIPMIFWFTAFIIDFFYYHRLLLGAVAQAKKYDDSTLFKKFGLGGMTSCIKNHVHPPTSKILLFSYYIFPVAVGLILIGLK